MTADDDATPTRAGWAEHSELVSFYESNRRRLDDLYPSERRFLPWLARDSESVLDIGCAAGGFSEIWRAYNRQVVYTGADTSARLVEAARTLHPELDFRQADCAIGLPYDDGYATTVQALGWLHWERDHARALRELWRVTGRYLFFDVRLQDESPVDVQGVQKLALTGEWDGVTTVPYICLAWPRFAELLLEFKPSRLFAYGYTGSPSDTVSGVAQSICFATFVLERGGPPPTTCLDLPIAWPQALAGQVDLRDVAELAAFAPDLDSVVDVEEGRV